MCVGVGGVGGGACMCVCGRVRARVCVHAWEAI